MKGLLKVVREAVVMIVRTQDPTSLAYKRRPGSRLHRGRSDCPPIPENDTCFRGSKVMNVHC